MSSARTYIDDINDQLQLNLPEDEDYDTIGGLLFAYYLDFSIGPAIGLFLGCELVIASLVARFLRGILNLQSKQAN